MVWALHLNAVDLRPHNQPSPHPRPEYALPPHQRPGNEQHCGREPQDKPNELDGLAGEPAKMHPSEPVQKLVPKPKRLARLMDGFKKIDDCIKGFRSRKVNPGDSPHEDERDGPKPHGAVQRPVEPVAILFPANVHAAAPMIESGPPNNRSGQTEQCSEDPADKIQSTAGSPPQEVVMKVREPQNKTKSGLQRVAEIGASIGIK